MTCKDNANREQNKMNSSIFNQKTPAGMFFRLPTGVFTLYVKDYLAFSFSKIAFNFATISGCSAAKFFFSPISCFKL